MLFLGDLPFCSFFMANLSRSHGRSVQPSEGIRITQRSVHRAGLYRQVGPGASQKICRVIQRVDEAVGSRPSDDDRRLIHQGKLNAGQHSAYRHIGFKVRPVQNKCMVTPEATSW
jgi:hypothetical protein